MISGSGRRSHSAADALLPQRVIAATLKMVDAVLSNGLLKPVTLVSLFQFLGGDKGWLHDERKLFAASSHLPLGAVVPSGATRAIIRERL